MKIETTQTKILKEAETKRSLPEEMVDRMYEITTTSYCPVTVTEREDGSYEELLQAHLQNDNQLLALLLTHQVRFDPTTGNHSLLLEIKEELKKVKGEDREPLILRMSQVQHDDTPLSDPIITFGIHWGGRAVSISSVFMNGVKGSSYNSESSINLFRTHVKNNEGILREQNGETSMVMWSKDNNLPSKKIKF